MDSKKYQSVTDVNEYIHRNFENDYNLRDVYVTGEVSNYRERPRHQYFTLKDNRSHISAVIWASIFRKINFRLKDGMKVNVLGKVSTYPRNGQYQIYIWRIAPAGIGQLYVHLKQVQMSLYKRGLFNPEHKRQLPFFPKRIAVITSRSGAVIRDIINNVRIRYPIAQIILYPASVQGSRATPSLVSRLNQISDNHDCDEVIIGRGGGSLEDLWAFESAEVAYAIYECSIPVISSVGHGTDHTTADLVADKTVSTPTEAAVAATPVRLLDTMAAIQDYRQRIINSVKQKITTLEDSLTETRRSAIFQHPQQIYEIYDQEVDGLTNRLVSAMKDRINAVDGQVVNLRYLLKSNSPQRMVIDRIQTVKLYRSNMINYYKMVIARKRATWQKLDTALRQLDPTKRMAQGYSIVTAKDGQVVKDVNAVNAGDKIKIHFKNGSKSALIIKDE